MIEFLGVVMPKWLYISIALYCSYLVMASLWYAWHGLKHHPAYQKNRATILKVMYVVVDLPVLFLTYAGTIVVFSIFKLLGFKLEDKK